MREDERSSAIGTLTDFYGTGANAPFVFKKQGQITISL
jgi:hypothetical protein